MNGFEASEKKLDIQLDREVTNIEIKSEEKKVSVRSRGGQQYEGDVVLVTVPLGVLKADVITFTPSLPGDFQEAVREVGERFIDCLIFFDNAGHVALDRNPEPGNDTLLLRSIPGDL